MYKLTVLLLILCSTTFAKSGSELKVEEVVGKIMVKESLFKNPYHCSSFLFETKNKMTLMATAHHCFPYGNEKKKRRAYAHNEKIRKIKKSYISYKMLEKVDNFNRDLTVLKPLSHKNLDVLKISKSPALLGDTVYVLGYAAKGGHQKLKLECTYIAKGAYSLPSRNMILGDFIKCSHDRNSIAGMSGGPILNEAGEVLGVLSAEILKDDHSSAIPILVYQPLEESYFINNKVNLDNSGTYSFSKYLKKILSYDEIEVEESPAPVTVKDGLVI
ncbi:MAG: hypothetical protein BM556_01570 [Bacteriovorax sp. MedPE-SWde]|nr:MAG: hypothetical protein BM556_01570 [Bacteriovorax sp. MedPE-SWde]